MGLAVPVFMASTTSSAYADAEQAASVPDAVSSSATADWDDAGITTAYWADAEQAASVPDAASSSATAYCADAGSSSSTAYWADAEPLTPPGRSPADVIPSWDRWSPVDEAPTIEEPQPEAGPRMLPKPKWCLPKRKIEAADMVQAFPKMKMKPPDTDEFKREVSARSADDRKRVRDWEDDSDRPWDARGPRGPQEGGPQIWMGQKFREGSGRWANAGGQHREKYSFYHRKKKEGCTGVDLQYYHPMAVDGYWAKKAVEEGVLSPYQMKQAHKNEDV